MNDFNDVVDEIKAEHGDLVAFLKIDGQKIRQLSQRYKVSSYPKFLAVMPNSNGNRYKVFAEGQRTYDNIKKWVLSFLNLPAQTQPMIA